MDVSFIIPAYNAAATITRTLDSIITQSWGDKTYEIIAVDDASSDNTADIIEQYRKKVNSEELIVKESFEQERDKNSITFLRQSKNQRQGAARNKGLSVAKGKYVAFVDADDIVMPGMVKALDYALKSDVDMLHCGMILQSGDKEHVVVSNAPKSEVMSAHTFCEEYHTVETCQSPCAYLYKNAFLQRTAIPFAEGRRLEDTDWVEKHLFAAETIACLDEVIYTYMENTSSTMHTTRYDTCADWWHFSYRRMSFASSIAEKAPKYAARLMEAARWGVLDNTKLRRLTRFSPIDYWRIRKRCGKECMKYLASMPWNGFTNLTIKYPITAFLCLLIAHPLTVIGRKLIQKTR